MSDDLSLWRDRLITELHGRILDLNLLESDRRWAKAMARFDAALAKGRALLEGRGVVLPPRSNAG